MVISNNSGAKALLRASEHGIAYHSSSTTHPNPDELDKAILQTLDLHAVDYIVTAGYMKKLKTRVLAAYAHRIFNTHPSLLISVATRGRGMWVIWVHEAVLAAGDKVTGITIHEVNEHYDEGDIIAQTRVPVMPNDTPMTLAARVQALERRFLIETLATILETTYTNETRIRSGLTSKCDRLILTYGHAAPTPHNYYHSAVTEKILPCLNGSVQPAMMWRVFSV